MTHIRFLLPLAALVAVALPASAQEDELYRTSIPYFDHVITVEVETPAAGTLRLLRAGRNAQIDVAARAPNGIAVAGLGGLNRDRLRLDAAGTGRVDYVVTVPEHIHVRIQLPDQDYVFAAPAEASTSFSWPASVGLGMQAPLSGVRTGDELYLVHSAEAAPQEITIEDIAAVRRIAIRTGTENFELRTSRPMTATPGAASRIAIQAGGVPLDVVINVPAGTRNFVVRVPQGIAFAIVDGQAQANCAPSTSQTLADGRQWVDITPTDGMLDCSSINNLPNPVPTPVPTGMRGRRGARGT